MSAVHQKGLIIIGNGIAGITAARTVRKLVPGARIRIISDESPYFYSRTALMYLYMGHMAERDLQPYEPQFWPDNRLELIRDRVLSLDIAAQTLRLQSGALLEYDVILTATGSQYNRFGWPGQDLQGVSGLYSLQDLAAIEAYSRAGITRAVLVGGGLIGIELAEMLHSRGIPVTLLVRETGYWGNILPREEAQLIEAEIRRHGIELRLQTELRAILGDKSGRVRAVETSVGDPINCNFVGLTAGVSPNLSALAGANVETARGVLVDRWMRTSARNVFAAGDCAQLRAPDGAPGAVEQLWYTGRMQGEIAGNSIAWMFSRNVAFEQLHEHAAPYDRGVWFNSAKFFTIEYQTYGYVPARLDADRTHVWNSRDGKVLIRLAWDENRRISGFNFLGTRYRQTLCQAWIREGLDAAEVARRLPEACFDPEFTPPYYQAYWQSWRNRFQTVEASA